MRRRRWGGIRARAALLLAVPLTNCMEPRTTTEAQPLTLNQPAEADLSPGVATHFVFETTTDQEVFTVHLQATSGTATVVVSFSGSELVRHRETTVSSDPLGRHRAGMVTSSGPGTFDIVLTGSGHARVEIFEPLPTPEHRAPEIAIGDTIREEIDGLSDTDELTLAVTAAATISPSVMVGDQSGAGLVQVDLNGPGIGNVVSFSATADGQEHSPGAVELLPGAYRFRVSGTYIGPYVIVIGQTQSAIRVQP